MTTTCSATWRSTIDWSSVDSTQGIANDKNENQHKDEYTFTADTGRRAYAKTITITAASSLLDIDLTNISDVNNNAFSFTTVEAIKIKNNNTTSGEKLLVGGAGSGNNAWGAPFNDDQDAKLTIGPGDSWQQTWQTDPLTVDATHKTLRLDNFNTTNDMTVDVIIIGSGS